MRGGLNPALTGPPTPAVIEAIEDGTSTVIRRVEIFESDSETPWHPQGETDHKPRLVEGTVSVDSGRDERRSLDLTLDNQDMLLRPNANGGLWYDKVIKVYRGVRVESHMIMPRIVIMEAPSQASAAETRSQITKLGFTDVTVKLNATSYSELSDYDILVSAMGTGRTNKHGILTSAYADGKGVITSGSGNDVASMPSIWAAGTTSAKTLGIAPVTYDHPLKGGWSAQTIPGGAVVTEDPAPNPGDNLVKIGSATRTLNGIDAYRNEDHLTIYTPASGVATPTNEYGTESVVEDGVVTYIVDRNGQGIQTGTPIPPNGYVLSGHESSLTFPNTSAKWLRDYATVGAVVQVLNTDAPPPASGQVWVPSAGAPGTRVAATQSAVDLAPTAVTREDVGCGGRWFHYQPHQFLSQGLILLGKAIRWIQTHCPFYTWEVQVGEFVIDQISNSNFPRHIRITGRDYTKRCMNSKLGNNIAFEAGTPVTDIVLSLAGNSGITKFKVPPIDAVIAQRMDLERGTSRWEVMKQAASSVNHEIFFDAQGYLVMREYADPALTAAAWTFQTGRQGNLVSWDRSISDANLFNHIIVVGVTAEGDGIMPYWGEAKNDEPSSPTSIQRIGNRTDIIEDPLVQSNEQAQAKALSWLKYKALESYEISWESINYPWLEAGEIIDFLDPDRLEGEPTRFLMDSLTIPLGLGPMSATGKRVTFVTDSSISITASPEDAEVA